VAEGPPDRAVDQRVDLLDEPSDIRKVGIRMIAPEAIVNTAMMQA
jgi:hypothetical protein